MKNIITIVQIAVSFLLILSILLTNLLQRRGAGE